MAFGTTLAMDVLQKYIFFFSFFGNDCRGSYNIIRCPVLRNFAEIAKIRNSLHTGLVAEPKQCTGFKTGKNHERQITPLFWREISVLIL